MENLPSLNALKVFVQAADAGSFSKAATELHSTQSAISQQIKQLESYLKLNLFYRQHRGVSLTDDGKALYRVCSESFDQIGSTIKQLQSSQSNPRIHVATDFACAAYWLLPRLSEFRKRHPEVDVRVITSQDVTEHLLDDVDIVIRYCEKPDNTRPSIESIRLFRESVFPICSLHLLNQHGFHSVAAVKSVDQLNSLPRVDLRDESSLHWMDWPRLYAQLGAKSSLNDPVFECDNYTLLVQAAIAGQGVGLGWSTLIDDLVDRGVLVALRQFKVSTQGGYFMMSKQVQNGLSHQDRKLAESLDQLMSWLSDEK